ncbi:hypothetical protein THAOC_28664, partial [Thalassiosira oceanica]
MPSLHTGQDAAAPALLRCPFPEPKNEYEELLLVAEHLLPDGYNAATKLTNPDWQGLRIKHITSSRTSRSGKNLNNETAMAGAGDETAQTARDSSLGEQGNASTASDPSISTADNETSRVAEAGERSNEAAADLTRGDSSTLPAGEETARCRGTSVAER